ncbi:receptor-like serine/threonine-protein kinase At1g78530 [Selaginella moellendorffii]|nr:receptor-like serine/threonine-protein kinase At1g78530 [Selaginella moellendorffii]|eukprot:XP_002970052.2 receptor-like serine/threonine-protein kinase At1g78530 [Selaginella moellendorffii]
MLAQFFPSFISHAAMRSGDFDDDGDDSSSYFRLPQMLKFSESEFLALTGNFSSSNILDRGSFSTVYKGVFPDGNVVAVKKLELGRRELRPVRHKSFFTELHVLGRIRHRNILPVLGYFSNLDFMAVIVQFMPKGSLHSKLQQRHTYISLDWSKRYKIAVGVAQGLTYLHHNCKQQFVHCDLNPSNILLDDEFEAHIGNFGFAKAVEQQLRQKKRITSFLLMPGYTAPEVFLGEKPSPEADVYSFGIVMLQLLTRKSPTSTEFGDGLTLRDWTKGALESGRWTDVLDPQLQQELLCQDQMLSVMEMAMSCCDELPEARPTMQTVTKFLVGLQDSNSLARFQKSIDELITDSTPSWGTRKQKNSSFGTNSFTASFTCESRS